MTIILKTITTNQAGVKGETYGLRESDALAKTDRNDKKAREISGTAYIQEMVETYGAFVIANHVAKHHPVKSNAVHKGLRTRNNEPMTREQAAKNMEKNPLDYQGGAVSTEQKLSKMFAGLSAEEKKAFLKANS
jgi:hypothetical protein